MILKRFFRYIHSGMMGDFMINVYATFFSVLLSLYTAELVSSYQQNKDVEAMMSILLDELDENMTIVNNLYDRIKLEKKGCRYLYQHHTNFDSIPKDSVEFYGKLPLQSKIYYFTYDGLEALKASGLLNKVPDRTVVLSIIKAYAALNHIEKYYSSYLKQKASYHSQLFNIPELSDLEKHSSSNWKIYIQYREALKILRELPQYQSSSMYLNKKEQLVKSIEHIKTCYRSN